MGWSKAQHESPHGGERERTGHCEEEIKETGCCWGSVVGAEVMGHIYDMLGMRKFPNAPGVYIYVPSPP